MIDLGTKKLTDIIPRNIEKNKAETIMDVQRKFENSKEKISKGLKKECASTGTPIDKLHGGAEFMAKLSNIGGGSLETGGGGVREGFNTINENIAARTVLEMQQGKNKTIKKTNDK